MNFKQLLVKNIFWQGLYVLVAFVLNLLMARVLGASVNGQLNYWQFQYSFLVLVLGLSLESALIYYAASARINAISLGLFSLLYTFIITALMFLVLFQFNIVHISDAEGNWKRWACWYVFGYLLINYFTALFYAKKQVVLPNIIKTFVSILLIAFLIYKWKLVAGESIKFITTYIFSFTVTGVMLCFAYFIFNKREVASTSFLSWAEMKMLFRYALMALFTNLIFFLVYRIDYWFVEKYCSTDALGNYTQASKWVQYFQMIPVFLAAAIFPAAASGMLSEKVDQLKKLNRVITWVYIIMLFILSLVSSWFFPLLYGESFNEMYIPFMILVPGIIALSSLALTAAYFAGINRIDINLKGNLIALLIIFTGNYLLTQRYGIVAAAAVSSIGYTINAIYSSLLFCRKTGSTMSELFGFRSSDIKNIIT
jgi:O-antigen/teichoic acid export membrane protein